MDEPVAQRSRVLTVVFAAGFVGMALVGLKYLPARRTEVPSGTKLTTLELTPLTDGTPAVSPASLSGKVVVINFWATWCGPCVEEMPHIAALAEQYRDRDDFAVVAVSCDDEADLESQRATVVHFLRNRGLNLPAYADPGGTTRRSLPSGIWTNEIPFTALVDRDGTIVGVWRGFREPQFNELKLRVATLLNAAAE